MNQDQLAELLGISVETLRAWRTRRFANKPQSLVPDMPPIKRKSCYSPANVAAWLMKNPDYRDRVVALLAPEPEFLHAQQVAQPVAPTPLGLAAIIPANYQLQGESV